MVIYTKQGHDVIYFQTYSDLIPQWNNPDANYIKPSNFNNSVVDLYFLFNNQKVLTYPTPP